MLNVLTMGQAPDGNTFEKDESYECHFFRGKIKWKNERKAIIRIRKFRKEGYRIAKRSGQVMAVKRAEKTKT